MATPNPHVAAFAFTQRQRRQQTNKSSCSDDFRCSMSIRATAKITVYHTLKVRTTVTSIAPPQNSLVARCTSLFMLQCFALQRLNTCLSAPVTRRKSLTPHYVGTVLLSHHLISRTVVPTREYQSFSPSPSRPCLSSQSTHLLVITTPLAVTTQLVITTPIVVKT